LTIPAELKRTPLHRAHLSASARMVEFAGWHMPVQYTGVGDEHRAVRTRAGLFDVSHMGEASVSGPQALAFLQHVTSNDVGRVQSGQAQYNALTTPQGTFIDDLLVYRLADGDYLLVLNAANTARDLQWLESHARRFDVKLRDVSADWALLSLQGPRSVACLQPLVAGSLADLRYYRFTRERVCGADCIVSRTGYTGEDGFEIFAPPERAESIWVELLRSGSAHGLVPIGLGARDTLRLEARMVLHGHDIDETTTVLEADLGSIVKLDKGEFIGREVLARQAERGVTRKLVGFEMTGRAIARHGYPAFSGEEEVGRVTSGTHAPFLQKNIGLAYLPIELAQVGREFLIAVRDRREGAVVVPTPFYKRPR
jgi:aminomethyltransferase